MFIYVHTDTHTAKITNSADTDDSTGRVTHCALLAVASSLLPAEVLDLLQPLCLVLICTKRKKKVFILHHTSGRGWQS